MDLQARHVAGPALRIGDTGRGRVRQMRHASPIIIGLWIAAGISSFAQTTEISGAVTDPAGATVPKAQVLLTGIDRGLRRTAVTNDEGWYFISLLPPGSYAITVRAGGFQTAARSGVRLNFGQPARIDFALVVGETNETIRVSGEAPLVNLDNGSLATTVDSTLAQGLPLNGRSFQALLSLAPGVVPTTNNQVGGFNVNGHRSTANAFAIDGTSATVASTFSTSALFSF